jgi:methyl-accepting chemotaxis protein
MAPFLRLIEALIPERVKADGDQYRAAQFIVGFLVAIAACCFVYQIFYRQAGNPGGANLIVLEGLLAPALIGLLHVTGRVKLVSQLFFVSFIALVTLLCLTMGAFTLVGLMPLLWGLTIPLAALLTMGQREGLAWVAVVGITVTGVYLLHAFGPAASFEVRLSEGEHLFFVWIHIFGLGFMITALGLLFAAANRGALEEAVTAREAAQGMAGQLELEKASVEAKVTEATREAEARSAELHEAVVAVLDGIGHFAEGDLTVRYPETFHGELGELAAGLNRATVSLEGLVAELNATAGKTAEAAAQVGGATGTVAERTERQAAAMQEARSSMDGITTQILSTADQAGESAALAERSASQAREGGVVVHETLERMRAIASTVEEASETVVRLGDESRRISDVVATIDDIAAQTHMLALNASIEAARAGVHGQGFSVVATEVRNLAERTAKATAEVAEISKGIEEGAGNAVERMSQGREEVQEGVRLTDEAAAALRDIVEATERVHQVVAQIASASRSQADVSRTVRERIEDAAGSADASAQDVSEIAGAVAELERLTDLVQRRVTEFRVTESQEAERAEEPIAV